LVSLLVLTSLLLSGLAILPGSAIADLASTSWPMFHHDLKHTGRSPYLGPQTNAVKWSYQTGDWVESSPAIGSDGTIYVGSDNDNLYAINSNGTLKWSYQTGSWVESSPAIGSDGTIYVGSIDGNLYAINPSGNLKWSYQTGNIVASSPTIGSDGTIYIESWPGKLYAINPNGTLKWSSNIACLYSSPAIGSDGTIYAGAFHGFYALNPDGSLKWSYNTSDEFFSSPAVGSDGTIYVGSIDGNLYAIKDNGTSSTLKWSYQTGEPVFCSPAIGSDGTVYVGSYDGKLYAINPDGTLKWSYQTGDIVFSSPAIGRNGTIYVGSVDGKIYAINPNGSLKWSYLTGNMPFTGTLNGSLNTGNSFMGLLNQLTTTTGKSTQGTLSGSYTGVVDSSPSIGSDGTLYVGAGDGKLYAFPGPVTASVSTKSFISTTPPQSSSAGGVPTVVQGPAPISNITVENISLSSAKVGPGAPITVTANVANTGTANGSSRIKLYINGQEEANQGVTLSSGSRTPIKFIVSRDEPGTYSVYVGSIAAGSFEVDGFADPNLILYISGALLLFALAGGVIFMTTRRRQR